jgi:prolyl oligopeptidase
VAVIDPYRVLENPESPITKAWIKKENELTDSYMKKLPHVEELTKTLSDN